MPEEKELTSEYRLGVCDVHLLVDGDSKERYVRFCAFCDAWMCDACSDNLPKRALAFERRLINILL